MPTRTYIVHGVNLGTGPAVHRHVHESYEAQRSEAYFCPICADIWCRMPVDPPQPWGVSSVPCDKHMIGWTQVCGSLWMPWRDPGFPASLPRKVLYRELELTIKHLEKFGQL